MEQEVKPIVEVKKEIKKESEVKKEIKFPQLDKKLISLKEKDKYLADKLNRLEQWEEKKKKETELKEAIFKKNAKLYPNSLPVLYKNLKNLIVSWFVK